MSKWTCIFKGRRIRDGFGDWEYENNRLFIKDGDHSRVYVCDNSGENPGRSDGGPTEIDLTKPGWLKDREPYYRDRDRDWDWCLKVPYDVRLPTVDDCWCGIEFEGALFLAEKYGMRFESRLSKGTQRRLEKLREVLDLTEAPLKQLAREAL